MAFSSAPTQDTYSSHRISLIHNLEIRPGFSSFDNIYSGMNNVVPFKNVVDNNNDTTRMADLIGETRDVIHATATIGNTVAVTRGMYVWEKVVGATIYYFMVVNDGTNTKVWTSTDGVNFSAVTTFPANGTSQVRFCEFIDSTNVKKLVLVDGTYGYVFTSNAAGTQIVDADFPSPHVPFPVFADGYLFLAKAGTGDIYNSDLNDPASWTPGNFISSELYPDDVQAMMKIGNYILVIGKDGSEYFYDAGNTTGSPLARYEGGSLPFGTVFPNSIAHNLDTVMFLANNDDGESAFKVVKGFTHQDIPANAVIRALATKWSIMTFNGSQFRACFIRQNGELLYVLNIDGVTSTSTVSLEDTVVASLLHKMWVEFTYFDGLIDSQYPVMFSAPASTGNLNTYVAGQVKGVSYFGYLTTGDADPVFNMTIGVSSSFTNAAKFINQFIFVPPESFGTLNSKTMSRLGISYVSLVSSNITVTWSDDFMNNFNLPWRVLAGSSDGPDTGFPYITQMGRFRQRGFYVAALTGRVRWEFIEVDINKGTK